MKEKRLTEHLFAKLIIDQSQMPDNDLLKSIVPAANLSPLDALMIYRGDYEARLTAALENKYEGTSLIAGSELFQQLSLIYLQSETSNVKDLKDFGANFPLWLQSSAPLHPDMNFLYEVAIVDKIFHELFHTPPPRIIKASSSDADKIFLNNGNHIHYQDFLNPAFSLWQYRYNEELPNDFNWKNSESVIFIKNHLNQIDSFPITDLGLKTFWSHFMNSESLLIALERTSQGENLLNDHFRLSYSSLLNWLTRHQLLRSN